MFPKEIVILMAIAGGGDTGKRPLACPADVTGDYISYLYNSLVVRGYLKENGSTGYQLTAKGQKALFEFLSANRTRARDTIRKLQLLGIEINQPIGI